MDDIDEVILDLRGNSPISTVYYNSDHEHDQVTWHLVSGIMCFVGATHLRWSRKRQGTIKTYSYSADFWEGQVATEESISMNYMLRSLSIPVKVPLPIFEYNLEMIISSTNPDSDLKKKHVAILYHKLWKSAAAGIFIPIKVCTTVNRSKIMAKSTLVVIQGSFSDASYWVNCRESWTTSPRVAAAD